MSIKFVHMFLIGSSILVLSGFGYWGTVRPGTVYFPIGAVSLISAAGLAFYLSWFARKSRQLP